jgi:hypothetical protein
MAKGVMSLRIIQNQAAHMANTAIKNSICHQIFTENVRSQCGIGW